MARSLELHSPYGGIVYIKIRIAIGIVVGYKKKRRKAPPNTKDGAQFRNAFLGHIAWPLPVT